jgi:hypothetical protein
MDYTKDLILQLLREQTFAEVKVDKNIGNRITQLMRALGVSDSDTIKYKLDFMSNPKSRIQTAEQSINAITLLETLKDLVKEFEGSGAGFLFESFMAGLMNGDVIPGNKPSDIVVGDTYYQSKLYDRGNYKPVLLKGWLKPESTSNSPELRRSDIVIFADKIGFKKPGDGSLRIYEYDVNKHVKINQSVYQNEIDKLGKSKNGEYFYVFDDTKLTVNINPNLELSAGEKLPNFNYNVTIPLGDIRDSFTRKGELVGEIKSIGEIILSINTIKDIGESLNKNMLDTMEKVFTAYKNFKNSLDTLTVGIDTEGESVDVKEHSKDTQSKLKTLERTFDDAKTNLFDNQ